MTPTRHTLELAIAEASGRGARVPCRRTYAEAHGECGGVWGGIDRKPSARGKGRMRSTSTPSQNAC